MRESHRKVRRYQRRRRVVPYASESIPCDGNSLFRSLHRIQPERSFERNAGSDGRYQLRLGQTVRHGVYEALQTSFSTSVASATRPVKVGAWHVWCDTWHVWCGISQSQHVSSAMEKSKAGARHAPSTASDLSLTVGRYFYDRASGNVWLLRLATYRILPVLLCPGFRNDAILKLLEFLRTSKRKETWLIL